MRLPRKLVVGDDIWAIKFKKNIGSEKRNGNEIVGLCDPSTHEITIKSGLTKDERISTAIHEILHSFEMSYGFTMDHKLVYKLEIIIFKFLMDNFPEFFI